MSCEYSLVSKINAINANLINKYELDHKITEDDIKETSSETPLTMIQTAIDTFGSSIKEESVTFLYQIFNVGWDTSSVDLSKQIWTLYKGDNNVSIRIWKGANKISFPIITESIQKIISSVIEENSAKIKKNCVEIIVNESTINDILTICESL